VRVFLCDMIMQVHQITESRLESRQKLAFIQIVYEGARNLKHQVFMEMYCKMSVIIPELYEK